MSIGLLVGETEAVVPDPRFIGLLVTRTMRDVIWDEIDYLLVDLPPGTGEPQQTMVSAVQVDGAVIVTTPQDLSLLDASRSLGFFRKVDVPIIGVIENMSYLNCPECGKRIEVFHRSNREWAVNDRSLDLLGRIPMDIAISRGIDEGHPLLQTNPDAIEAAVFRDIAKGIAGYFSGPEWPPAPGS
jgi:ATP-binding protein involved in chromosome partitioning